MLFVAGRWTVPVVRAETGRIGDGWPFVREPLPFVREPSTQRGASGGRSDGFAGGGGLRRIQQDQWLTGKAVDNRLVQFLHRGEHK